MDFEVIEGGMAQHTEIAKDVFDSTFEQEIIMESTKRPVIAVFYMALNPHCSKFIETFEKAVKPVSDKIALVKVNIDKSPILVSSMQIQSVPSTYIFLQGQPIDGFAGVIPEENIKSLVSRILEVSGAKPQEEAPKNKLSAEDVTKLKTAAEEFFANEKYDEALTRYSALLENDEGDSDALGGLGWCLASMGDVAGVTEMVANFTEEQKLNEKVKGLMFLVNIKSDKNVKELKAEKDNTPEGRFNLAKAYITEGKFDEAVDELVSIVKENKGWGNGKAKSFLVEFFGALGVNHAVARRGKRKLSAVLFS